MLYYTLGLNGRRYTEIILIVLFTVMGFAVADDIIQAAFVSEWLSSLYAILATSPAAKAVRWAAPELSSLDALLQLTDMGSTKALLDVGWHMHLEDATSNVMRDAIVCLF